MNFEVINVHTLLPNSCNDFEHLASDKIGMKKPLFKAVLTGLLYC